MQGRQRTPPIRHPVQSVPAPKPFTNHMSFSLVLPQTGLVQSESTLFLDYCNNFPKRPPDSALPTHSLLRLKLKLYQIHRCIVLNPELNTVTPCAASELPNVHRGEGLTPWHGPQNPS